MGKALAIGEAMAQERAQEARENQLKRERAMEERSIIIAENQRKGQEIIKQNYT